MYTEKMRKQQARQDYLNIFMAILALLVAVAAIYTSFITIQMQINADKGISTQTSATRK